MGTLKQYWDYIYRTKSLKEVSWYERVPETSLFFVEKCHLPREAAIIDVGGGDSFLVESLLIKNYSHLTVLDISPTALDRAKIRMGEDAHKIRWIECDVLDFTSSERYDLWHDRAAFHFLTDPSDQRKYVQIARRLIKDDGYLLLGTFSGNGPEKCSGLPVQRYSEDSMSGILQPYFKKVECITKAHATPFNTTQEFLFCCFKKR